MSRMGQLALDRVQGAVDDLFSVADARPLSRARTAPPKDVPLEVATLFEHLALEVWDSGLRQYAAHGILDRMRWTMRVERQQAEFKVNNNWSRPLAIWFLANHPDKAGFFVTRERRQEAA